MGEKDARAARRKPKVPAKIARMPLRVPLPKPQPVLAPSPPRLRPSEQGNSRGATQDIVAYAPKQNTRAGEAGSEEPGAEDDETAGFLSYKDRAKANAFFNGTRIQDIMLEGAVAAGTPEKCRAALLHEFPRGFMRAEPKSGPCDLVKVLATFISGGKSKADSVLSAEVRQSLVTDSRGRRLVRKSIFVNGN